MIIDLLGGSYAHKFADWNVQRSVNWYPVKTTAEEKNKTPMALFPRPGLKQLVQLPGNIVRGLFTSRTLTEERCFAVTSNILYEIHIDGSSTTIGTMSNMATGTRCKVYMEVNGNNQLMIQDFTAGYIFDLGTDTLTHISDADYPGGGTLTYADGYFIISDNEGRVTFSELNDGLNWSGDSVFTPTFKADAVKAVLAFREEIYCFGAETIEIYLNDGTTPFVRQSRTSIYYGIASANSLASWHGGSYFVGSGRFGSTEVYELGTNYAPRAISSPAITQALNKHDLTDAEGYVKYSKDGHIFYFLHVPAAKTTYVYDATLNLWHEQQSTRPHPDADGSEPQDMYRGRLFTNFRGKNLHGDWFSGKLLVEDDSVSTDDGKVRKLTRVSPVFNNELKYISVYGFELDMNSGYGTTDGQGSSPTLTLKYSLNGGNTFEGGQTMEMGKLGAYDYRVQINKLGTARDWVISFEITDPIDIAVMQARARGVFAAW